MFVGVAGVRPGGVFWEFLFECEASKAHGAVLGNALGHSVRLLGAFPFNNAAQMPSQGAFDTSVLFDVSVALLFYLA